MFLMHPFLDDWLPKDHSARFISEVVDERLDLSVIYVSYVEASGVPPYDRDDVEGSLVCLLKRSDLLSRDGEAVLR